MDDTEAVITGAWTKGGAVGSFVGEHYLHDDNSDKGKKRVRFTPKLPAAGRYEVRLYYSAFGNRATNVPVVIHAADGEKTIKVNERQPPDDGRSQPLGVFEFKAGDGGWVEVRTTDTDGHVIADAVQFIPAK